MPPQDNKLPPLEELAMGDQVQNAPPPMTDRDIKAIFLTLTQPMTSQANSITSQVQAMKTQMNREVGARVPQHTNNMASRLRDFIRMNPPMFVGLKLNENPQDLFNEVYKILYSMGVT